MRSYILFVVCLISLQASVTPETKHKSTTGSTKEVKKHGQSPRSSPEQIPRQVTSPSFGKQRLGKISEEKGSLGDSDKKSRDNSGGRAKGQSSAVNSELTGLSLTLNFKEEGGDEGEDDGGKHVRNKSKTEVKYSDDHDGPETKKTITITGLKQKVTGRIAEFPHHKTEEEDENPLRRRFGDGEGPFGIPPPVILTTPMWTPPANRRKVTSKKYEPGVLEALTANLMTGDHGHNKNLANDVTNVALELLDNMMGNNDNDDGQAEVGGAGNGQDGRRRRNRKTQQNRKRGQDNGTNVVQQTYAGYQPAAMYSYDPITGQNILLPIYNPYMMNMNYMQQQQVLSPHPDDVENRDRDDIEEFLIEKRLAMTGKQRVVMTNLFRLGRMVAMVAGAVGYFFLFSYVVFPGNNSTGDNRTAFNNSTG